MFKLGRRTLAGLTAAAAVAGGLGTAAATPQVAAAAPFCNQWHIPSSMVIYQDNNWTVQTTSRRKRAGNGFEWKVVAYQPGTQHMDGTLRLTRFDTDGFRPRVQFSIKWAGRGGTGTYQARIEEDGTLAGATGGVGFHFDDPIGCDS